MIHDSVAVAMKIFHYVMIQLRVYFSDCALVVTMLHMVAMLC